MIKCKEVAYDEILAAVYYDESSPSCLRWKVDVRAGRGVGRLVRAAGDVAGSLSKKQGRWLLRLNNRGYQAGRVVYCPHNKGISSDFFIDHFDGDATNNKIGNLRLVTQRVNAHNSKFRKNNVSGVKGVYRQEGVSGKNKVHAYWVAAYMSQDNKLIKKLFSVTKLGEVEAREAAVAFRDKAMQCLNNAGEGYTDRHPTNQGESKE